MYPPTRSPRTRASSNDLDIDSLSMVEIAVAAQDKFGVEIPDDELKNLKTVPDVVKYVHNAEVSA